MRHAILALPCALALAAGGCSSASTGLSTASVSGTGAAGAPAAPAAPVHDATSRALQVGSTAARAVKCGYNFDPAKLKASFLASEGAINPADVAKATQVYEIAYNGVTKAVLTKADYCSASKTAEIKSDLTRHLAGDFTPPPPKAVAYEPGFFDSWGDGNGSESGPKFGTNDWWDKQAEKKGG
jgi:hypothetical protein